MDKVELCKELLQQIEEKGRMPVTSEASDSDSEPLELVLLLTLLTLLFQCMALSDDTNTILHIKLTYTFTNHQSHIPFFNIVFFIFPSLVIDLYPILLNSLSSM